MFIVGITTYVEITTYEIVSDLFPVHFLNIQLMLYQITILCLFFHLSIFFLFKTSKLATNKEEAITIPYVRRDY